MRLLRNAALFALTAFPLVSQAEIVTYEFSANVWNMFTSQSSPSGYINTTVTNSSLAGGSISMGDQVTGRISFDTSIPASWTSNEGDSKMYMSSVQQLQFQFVPSGIQFSNDGSFSYTLVKIPSTTYSFSYVAFAAPSGGNWGNLDFDDWSGKTPGNLDMPSHLNLGDYSSTNLSYYWHSQEGGPDLYVDARLDSLKEVSAVPEPSQWMMLAAGALLLIGASRRARRS
jgi:hypothetical protein